ncbi:MAG: SMC-Scp complex subunit ScpB [Deltaproteobacteria bacterium]|nr:SMC-Scp complex subunit ScpB [Deltaproteobacteria bacterium]
MEAREKRQVLEALLLAAAEPVSAQKLAGVLGEETTPTEVRGLLAALEAEYAEAGRGFRIEEVAGGFQLRTLPELAPWLQRLRPQPPLRLSRAALETLAIVAYKQPITRAELELVRGVDVGAVVTSLLERRLVRIAGHREVPGRPMLYATTRRFLEVFGLASLSDLPTLREIEELLRDRAAAASEAGELPAGAAAATSPCDGDEEEGDFDPDAEPELEPPVTTH